MARNAQIKAKLFWPLRGKWEKWNQLKSKKPHSALDPKSAHRHADSKATSAALRQRNRHRLDLNAAIRIFSRLHAALRTILSRGPPHIDCFGLLSALDLEVVVASTAFARRRSVDAR